jgi:hypothetical protein
VRTPDPRQDDLFIPADVHQRLYTEYKAAQRERPAYNAGRTQRGQKKKRNVQQTSLDAHESIKPTAAAVRGRILAELQARGSTGATCDELEQALNMKHQTVSARITEMKKSGTIYDTGHRRDTRTGRGAAVLRAREGER